jgi:hypothetical protein
MRADGTVDMPGYRYSISLRIWHPTRSLEDVADEINLTPTTTWKAGSPWITKAGRVLSRIHAEHYWTSNIIKGYRSDHTLADAISDVLDKFMPKRDFFTSISASGGRSEIFVGWFFPGGNSGDVLGHKLLGRLADLSMDLSFDIYP